MTELTPIQQIHIAHAEQFLAARDDGRAELAVFLDLPIGSDLDAYALGAAAEHMQRLLAVIGDLTGDAS
jgi:hypothetical protein